MKPSISALQYSLNNVCPLSFSLALRACTWYNELIEHFYRFFKSGVPEKPYITRVFLVVPIISLTPTRYTCCISVFCCIFIILTACFLYMNYLDLGEYKVKTDNRTQRQLPASFPKTILLLNFCIKYLVQIPPLTPNNCYYLDLTCIDDYCYT